MIALHRNNSQLKTTRLLSTGYRVTEHSEARSSQPQSESGPRVETAGDVDRVRFLIWGFVLFSFAALFFCGWILWAKCQGHWLVHRGAMINRSIGTIQDPQTR